ncbi:hypothetical protein BQ8794_70226 [Mesorhizobium prunaredense]|uniref:Uncharacterized protein n=1 Tax=Mesorhizobium prunaredense TaxID=1631249 RepID=A0A1R3VH97_9HYPH|nr:hypothetical protein [Mesorhizobium prunaredense]SIT59296.1 hypothetical protein BQ8794_70226 [Mesorhizobium prunaredense]
MPQSLSTKPKITQWREDESVLADHPTLSPYIAQVVAISSMIEHQWAIMLCYIAKADPRAAVVMHRALNSTAAQMAAFEAVAAVRLSDDSKLLHEAVKMATKGYTRIRNEFCHHLWADTIQSPDVLLLIDPIVTTDFMADMEEPVELTQQHRSEKRSSFQRSKIMVYNEKDLEAARTKMSNALLIIRGFCDTARRTTR